MAERARRRPINATVAPSGQSSVKGAVRRHKPDYWILILTSLLVVIGLVVVYSISPGLSASQHTSQSYFITKQLINVVLGLGVFAVAAYLPTNWWWKAAKPLAIAAVIGSIVVLFTPIDEVYQAHRWIRLGGFSFQIAELIKLALLAGVARFLTLQWQAGRLADYKLTLRPLLVLLVVIGIVVAKYQSDLGSTGVMLAIIGFMALTAGIPLKRIALIGGLVVIMVTLAIASSGYRRERLSTYLHPDCQGNGYQACQALISVGSGGLFGLGLGYSVQAYGYTPEASNDSIFAIMAEEFGFIGTVIIVLIYAAFITRLKKVIEHTKDQFSRLMVVGVLAWLSTQMIINVGAMLGLLPLKGITLPLISQGGTSMIFLMAALGLVFQISRYTSYSKCEPEIANKQSTNNYYSPDGRRLGRPYNAPLATRPRT